MLLEIESVSNFGAGLQLLFSICVTCVGWMPRLSEMLVTLLSTSSSEHHEFEQVIRRQLAFCLLLLPCLLGFFLFFFSFSDWHEGILNYSCTLLSEVCLASREDTSPIPTCCLLEVKWDSRKSIKR